MRRRPPSICLVAFPLLALFPGTPAFSGIPAVIHVYDPAGTASERVLVASLEGIVAKTSPEVYLGSDFWLDELKARYPAVRIERHASAAWFLAKYKSSLKGYILYDDGAIDVATSIAGVERAVLVDSTTAALAAAAGLRQLADVRGKDTAWVLANYGSRLSRDYLFHQGPSYREHLRDFAILHDGLTVYEPDQNSWFSRQDRHTRVFGWASSEYDFFVRCSQNDLMAVAADWLLAAATTSGWAVPVPRQRTHLPANTATAATAHYVSFVMSDGDNVQFLTNSFFESPWFGSSHRGEFSMTWDISPSLAEVSPLAIAYYYDRASAGTAKDFFVNAGGPGLMFPSLYPDVDGFASVDSSAMLAADLNVISVLDPGWDTAKLDAILDDPQVLGMMFKTYGEAYRGRHGEIHWHGGKPCVTVKYSLWDGFDTPASLSAALNAAPRSPRTDQGSYSVVNVHPWSGDPMATVAATVSVLDPAVKVVTLEELVIHLRNNFGTPVRSKTFRRGDASGNGTVDLIDAVRILFHLFVAGATFPCEKAADADDSGAIDLTDAVCLLTYLFLAGPSLPAPGPACGPDPTADDLTCAVYAGCP